MNELPAMIDIGSIQGALNAQAASPIQGTQQLAHQIDMLVKPLEERVREAHAKITTLSPNASEEERARVQAFFTELSHDVVLWHGIVSHLGKTLGELARGQ
jgi:hypothetical protein